MVLEAIRYSRGSLQLLEQRLLPLQTEWIEIKGVEDGWNAIRDMTVRGAPAIADAAALSLAVELVQGGSGSQFASASHAVEQINAKLDYLATSRPTAVNLFDAVRRLSTVASTAAAEANATGSSVTEAVVSSAEAMLKEDVEANKIMGKHGAAALLAAAQSRGRATNGKLRVLTHCNTGSLATAAYGTALGVVRALHEQGHLEHAYCTETRPYNQGARLTAFELVTDGLPSTLICDSAAAALMAEGKVDAVVVGADRIAANGDTANKIGTFSLAVAANFHDIPFFTAAPVTTLDPELRDGTLIPIEQRSPEEITHFKGQRVAAEIDVWNPSFDVTPARLLEGVITEQGLVPRKGQKGEFTVRTWLAELGLLNTAANGKGVGDNNSTANGTSSLPTVEGFTQLTNESVKEFVSLRPNLAKHVGSVDSKSSWQVEEVGDGNLNFVFIVRGPLGALCIKQAPPYVRCVGEGWPLTQDRVRIEAAALEIEAKHCPLHIPALYHADAPMCLIAMEYIPPPHIILRKGLIQGNTYPLFAEQVSTLLATTLFHTSLLAMPSTEFRKQIGEFENNEMCRLTEQVIFTDPYFKAEFNRHTSPQLDEDAAALYNDAEAKAAAANLKLLFIQKKQALLHGDLHTGSIMVTHDTAYAIDPEFAFVGPIAFDVAKVLANLLLAYFAADGHAAAAGDRTSRSEQKHWLLESVSTVWSLFVEKFTILWNEHGSTGDAYAAPVFGPAAPAGAAAKAVAQQKFFSDVWDETVGFAGAVIIRRLVGIAHVADMDEIEDQEVRAQCERRALKFGRRLLVGGGADFDDVGKVSMAAAEAS
jgi:5-methylthioribose kinase